MFKRLNLKPEPEEEYYILASETEINNRGTFAIGVDTTIAEDSSFCEWIAQPLDEDFFEEEDFRLSKGSIKSIYPRSL